MEALIRAARARGSGPRWARSRPWMGRCTPGSDWPGSSRRRSHWPFFAPDTLRCKVQIDWSKTRAWPIAPTRLRRKD